MKILVTGSEGYVGSALVPHLVKAGHSLVCCDWAGGDGVTYNCSYHKIPLDATTVWKSLDAIVHLAGHSTVEACRKQPGTALRNNLLNFLEFAQAVPATVPLIYASSGSVYGRTKNAMEFDPLPRPIEVYDAHKQAVDCTIFPYHQLSYGLRLGTVCGPAPGMRMTAFNAMAKAAAGGGPVQASPGYSFRGWLAITDLCNAVEAVLGNSPTPGIYNLASFNKSMAEIAHVCAVTAGGNVKVENKFDGEPSAYDFSLNTSKAKEAGIVFRETPASVATSLIAHFRAKAAAA